METNEGTDDQVAFEGDDKARGRGLGAGSGAGGHCRSLLRKVDAENLTRDSLGVQMQQPPLVRRRAVLDEEVRHSNAMHRHVLQVGGG